MVEDGARGIIVDPHDEGQIARAISSLLDPQTHERMSQRSRRIANERFRASSVARRTYDVYREVLGLD